tara:strand:- start:1098 stop:1433 length:336 start_codon:yes stop_codon:yes gene_type:complete
MSFAKDDLQILKKQKLTKNIQNNILSKFKELKAMSNKTNEVNPVCNEYETYFKNHDLEKQKQIAALNDLLEYLAYIDSSINKDKSLFHETAWDIKSIQQELKNISKDIILR